MSLAEAEGQKVKQASKEVRMIRTRKLEKGECGYKRQEPLWEMLVTAMMQMPRSCVCVCVSRQRWLPEVHHDWNV